MQTDTLVRRLQNYPGIISAYLFGSGMREQRLAPLSDFDLALMLESSTSSSKTLSLICDVSSDIQELYHREGDVKILNGMDDLPFLIRDYFHRKSYFRKIARLASRIRCPGHFKISRFQTVS
ncbi:nucleotidyltransferase domain-containing protein [bacterium]|nr:nucleotidyltransferase domain-containing protein [bacterium]